VTEAGLVEKEELEKVDEEVRALIDEAVEEAKAASEPREDQLLTDVYVSY
jgi:acetoin:2,6-dichlorophenolindophenol oxidoreductase subunit alpha